MCCVCEQIWALFKQTPLARNWKWKAPWPTAASPYAGKWVSSRDSWLCQVWQKWPVVWLWLLLMLNYINYECGSQQAWGGRSISVSLLKAVPLIIHHRPCSTEPQIQSAVCTDVCVCVCARRNAPSRSSAGQTRPPQRSRCHGQGHWVPSGWWTSEQVNGLSSNHDLYLYTEQNQGVMWFLKKKDHHIMQRSSASVQASTKNKDQFSWITFRINIAHI